MFQTFYSLFVPPLYKSSCTSAKESVVGSSGFLYNATTPSPVNFSAWNKIQDFFSCYTTGCPSKYWTNFRLQRNPEIIKTEILEDPKQNFGISILHNSRTFWNCIFIKKWQSRRSSRVSGFLISVCGKFWQNFLLPPSIFHLTSWKIYHNYILIFLSPPSF